RACAIAAFASKKRPPSEKESGVIFTTPITNGRSREKEKFPQRNTAGMFPESSLSRGGRCRSTLGAAVARGRLRARLGRRRLGRTRRLARQDVRDLVRDDGFPLEKRLGHRLYLVAVGLQQVAREAV